MKMDFVLANDTSFANHHGCRLVSRTIKKRMEELGFRLRATLPVGADWSKQRQFLRTLDESRVLLVNGEGTLHHAQPEARRLIELVDYSCNRQHKVFVINSIWQDNPSSWAKALRKANLVSVRDSRSKYELALAGIDALLVPDLTLSSQDLNQAHPATPRTLGIIWGDSVIPQVANELCACAKERGEPFVPMASSNKRLHLGNGLSRIVAFATNARYFAKTKLIESISPKIYFVNEDDFIDYLSRSTLHITGRFHGICLALKTRTPFLGIKSNSRKIEVLLEDVGLGYSRLFSNVSSAVAALTQPIDFTPDERRSIDKFLHVANSDVDNLFNKIKYICAS